MFRIQDGKAVVFDLGLEDYGNILVLQRHLNALRNENLIGDCVFFLEHNDVYTLGIHRNADEILSEDISPIEVERGGSATYHGPGQLVIYLIINLKQHGFNVKDLIQLTQEAIIEVLEEYSIKGEGRLHGETGVWVAERKICSIGFALKGFSTLHGFALNISTDLSKFGAIMPCGMNSTIMTSMENETKALVVAEKVRKMLKEKLLSELGIKNYLEINSLKKGKEYLVGNGLRLLPEELLKVVI